MGRIIVSENVTLDGVVQLFGSAHLRISRRALAIPQRRAGNASAAARATLDDGLVYLRYEPVATARHT